MAEASGYEVTVSRDDFGEPASHALRLVALARTEDGSVWVVHEVDDPTLRIRAGRIDAAGKAVAEITLDPPRGGRVRGFHGDEDVPGHVVGWVVDGDGAHVEALWDLDEGGPPIFTAPDATIESLAEFGDRLIAGGYVDTDGDTPTAALLDIASGQRTDLDLPGSVTALVMTPDRRLLAFVTNEDEQSVTVLAGAGPDDLVPIEVPPTITNAEAVYTAVPARPGLVLLGGSRVDGSPAVWTLREEDGSLAILDRTSAFTGDDPWEHGDGAVYRLVVAGDLAYVAAGGSNWFHALDDDDLVEDNPHRGTLRGRHAGWEPTTGTLVRTHWDETVDVAPWLSPTGEEGGDYRTSPYPPHPPRQVIDLPGHDGALLTTDGERLQVTEPDGTTSEIAPWGRWGHSLLLDDVVLVGGNEPVPEDGDGGRQPAVWRIENGQVRRIPVDGVTNGSVNNLVLVDDTVVAVVADYSGEAGAVVLTSSDEGATWTQIEDTDLGDFTTLNGTCGSRSVLVSRRDDGDTTRGVGWVTASGVATMDLDDRHQGLVSGGGCHAADGAVWFQDDEELVRADPVDGEQATRSAPPAPWRIWALSRLEDGALAAMVYDDDRSRLFVDDGTGWVDTGPVLETPPDVQSGTRCRGVPTGFVCGTLENGSVGTASIEVTPAN